MRLRFWLGYLIVAAIAVGSLAMRGPSTSPS